MRGSLLTRVYECFSEEQQEYYSNKLSAKEQLYVDFRGKGFGKTDSVRMAGYNSKTPSAVANSLEKHKPQIIPLVQTLMLYREKQGRLAKSDDIDVDLMAKLVATDSDNAIRTLAMSDSEMARRVNFYRDIVNGRLKNTKVIQDIDPKTGEILKRRVEESDDIATRIKAREKLDELLGLNRLQSLGQLQIKDITINFVDASKKEEVQDERNKVDLDVNAVEVEAEAVQDGE